MKTLLILLLISYVKGDKLNNLYLPPVGANDSGGLSGDIEVPFEVPVQRYFGVDESLKLITEKEPNKSFHGIEFSTHAPSVSSVISYDDKSTIPVSGGSTATKDDLSTPIDVNEDYNPNQLFDYNNEKPTPITNDKNQSNNIGAAPETSKPSSSFKKFSNYKGNRISPISNAQYVPNFDYYTTNVKRILRPQTESDKNAIVLSDKNVITSEGFSYSYDTSNGIHADESGTATDGVKAHGSYSYVGDDGKLYNVTYTADENGFRPRGDHLPTPPPIPEAILKVIEQAAIDKSNGIFDDGSYDENKYGYKKYENSLDRLSSPVSSRRFNSGSNKPKNDQHANTENSRVENYIPTLTTSTSYTAYEKNDNFNKESASNDQDIDDDKNQETVNFNKTPNHPHNQKESELDNAFNQDFHASDFPNTLEENGLGYKYLSPKNKFVFSNNINTDISNDLRNKSPPIYVYDKSYSPESDLNHKLFLTRPLNTTYNLDLDKNKDFINLALNPVTDNGYISIKNPEIDKFGKLNLSRPPTGSFSSYNTSTTLKPLYLPQGSTKALEVTYEVSLSSSTERIIPVGTYTDRQSNFYELSSTEIMKKLDAHTDQPSNFYGPSSTESIKQLDTYTNRPSNFYGPSSTGMMNLPGTYTNQPRYFYGLPTAERIKEGETYANETDEFYGPSSTERINPFGTNDDQLSDFYGSLSNERIKPIGTYTDGPNDLYGPSSTGRIFSDKFAGPKQAQSYNPQTGYHY